MAVLVRHACARLGFVRVAVIVQHGDEWRGVVDDGRGFDQTTDPPAGHVGLHLIRDTVAEAGGTLLLDSGTGRGTRVRLSLPEG